MSPDTGIRLVGRCFLGLGWVASLRVQGDSALPEPSLAFGGLISAGGDADRLSGGILVMSCPQNGISSYCSLSCCIHLSLQVHNA